MSRVVKSHSRRSPRSVTAVSEIGKGLVTAHPTLTTHTVAAESNVSLSAFSDMLVSPPPATHVIQINGTVDTDSTNSSPMGGDCFMALRFFVQNTTQSELERSHDVVLQEIRRQHRVHNWTQTLEEVTDFYMECIHEMSRPPNLVGVIPTNLYLFLIYSILTFGISGNILLFFLMQIRLPNAAYSVYLRFLAVSDSVYLLVFASEDILDHHFHVLQNFLTFDMWLCKIWTFAGSASRALSPWLVVFFTLDRFLVVVFPLKRKIICSVKGALAVCSVLAVVCMLENLIFFIKHDIYFDTTELGKKCDAYYVSEAYLLYAFSVKGIFLNSILPCGAILFLNVGIVNVIQRRAAFKASRKAEGVKEEERANNSDSKIVASLIAVSLMAFLTLFPVSVVEVCESILGQAAETDRAYDPYYEAAGSSWYIAYLVSLLNYGQNFYVLVLTSTKYRQEFLLMLRPRGNKKATVMSSVNRPR